MASARGIGTKQVTGQNMLEVVNREVIPLLNALARAQGAWLSATGTWTPGAVVIGTAIATTVTVNGARVGDPVSVGFDQPGDYQLTGQVMADNVVDVTLFALGALALAEGTLTVLVWRRT